MITVSKTTLKARMPAYFRQVEESGEVLIVTEHRRPVIRVERIPPTMSLLDAFAELRGGMQATPKDILVPETAAWGDLT